MAYPSDGGNAAVDLYWLPLGAGGHFVRLNGRVYEAIAARLHRRRRCDLYHSALQIQVAEGRYAIEQAPVPDLSGSQRGVVAEGPVGARWAGRYRVFRYEVRLWFGGRNSNSIIAWTLARSGIDVEAIEPPRGGRAPGWSAGLVLARR